jgi:hypothetical protein
MFNQEKSLVTPGYFGSNQDNIIIVENFIDKQDLKTIQDFCLKINKWVDTGENQYADDGTCIYDASYWADRQCSGEIIKSLDPNIYDLIDKYILKMKLLLENKFNVELFQRPPVIIKWIPGTEQMPHADKQLTDGSPNPFPNYDINSLFYYNDDFEGGQLYYPEFDLVIEPKPGLAVAHPGDINYLHGVKKIISGERFTTPSFYSITKVL